MMLNFIKDFIESEHPRDDGGKFTSGGGGRSFTVNDRIKGFLSILGLTPKDVTFKDGVLTIPITAQSNNRSEDLQKYLRTKGYKDTAVSAQKVGNSWVYTISGAQDKPKPKGTRKRRKKGQDKTMALRKDYPMDDFDQDTKDLDIDEKCYSPYGGRKLEQEDPRVNYDPLGGRTGSQACANCFFFNPGGSSCSVVHGEIVATGVSDMWTPIRLDAEDYDVDPIPVTIVDEREIKPGIRQRVNRFVKSVFRDKPFADLDQGFKVASINGERVWLAWWSNNFEDRAGEIFSEKSLDRFVKSVDEGTAPYPELWYRHMPVPAGQAQWVGRVGHLMLAAGKFYDTEVGRKFYAHYKTSKIPYTISHGFLFPKKAKVNGVYHAFTTYEISPLLPGEEANPITGFGVKEIMSTISQSKKADLENIVGAELAAKYLQFGEDRSQELEKFGFKFKEAADDAINDDVARTALGILSQSQKDFQDATNQQLTKIGETLEKITKALESAATPPPAPTPEPPAAAKKDATPSNEERLERIEKALDLLTGLAPRATMSQATHVPDTDTYAGFLKSKMDDQAVPGGLFGDIFKNAGFEVPASSSDGK